MTKKLLLLSFYAPPLNGVPSYRVKSFLDFFPDKNINVTLVTRSWNADFLSWQDALSKDQKSKSIFFDEKGNKIYHLPFKSGLRKSKWRLINKFKFFYLWLSGNLQPEVDFYQYRDFCFKLLKNESFDFVMATVPPNNIIKLTFEIHKEFDIPYILDFRDYFNRIKLLKNQSFNLKSYFFYKISLFHMRKWVRKSSLIISVSPRINNCILRDFKRDSFLITNGFDSILMDKVKNVRNKKFTFRYLGSAYNHQDFSLFVNAFNSLVESGRDNVMVEVIGSMNEIIENHLKLNINPKYLSVSHLRIPQGELYKLVKSADVLLLPWNNFNGVYGTKLFDYIGSGNYILLAPSDNGLVEKLIEKNNFGKAINDSEKLTIELMNLYDKWIKNEKLKINNSGVFSFSRKAQAYKYADLIMNL